MLPNNAKQDLVFSVVLTPGTGQNFQLTALEFAVPLAPPLPLIDTGYDYKVSGGGVTMLSNMRFVAVAEFTLDGKWLMLSVVPRSVKGWWWASEIGEVSFSLKGVVVQVYEERKTIVLAVAERYEPGRAYGNHLAVELVPP
jgi:hypothetical protein